MNHSNSIAIQQVTRRISVLPLLGTVLVSLITLLLAGIATIVNLTFSLVVGIFRTITHLSFKCIVYILLVTIFILAAIIGIILSIITLGTISLP